MALPSRENEVLRQLSTGPKGRIEIAKNMHLSPRTVGYYITKLREKKKVQATIPDNDMRRMLYRLVKKDV